MFLAVNDVLSAPRRYATIVITFFICTLFVLVFVNLISTMRSDTCITTFGSRSDLYYTDLAEAMSSMNPDGLERSRTISGMTGKSAGSEWNAGKDVCGGAVQI